MKKIFVAIVVGLIAISSYSQDNSSLYLMKDNPLSLEVNPANPIYKKFYIGIPVLSNFNFSAQNAFKYNDLVEESLEGLILKPGQLYESLKDNNPNAINLNLDILNFGFRVNKTFISVGLRNKTYVGIDYPKELMGLIVNGNGAYTGETLEINNLDVSANSYMELSVGIQEIINEKLIVGIRPKFLLGIANVGTNEFRASIMTPDDYSHIRIEEEFVLRTSFLYDMFDTKTFTGAFSNLGIAFDLGATYKIDEKFSVGLSVLDLGYIKWESNNYDIVSNGEYVFEGVELDGVDVDFNNVVDSIASALNVETINSEPYTARTYTKIMAQGNYDMSDKHRFSATVRLDCIEGKVYPLYSVAYIGNLVHWFEVVANTYYYRGLFKIGAAVNFDICETVKIYASLDNLIGTLSVKNTKYLGGSLGVALTF